MKVLTNNQYYSDIADTIRQMKGVTTTYKPREMASALREMYSTEVEGVPPLTFPSNGNNLLNYRIDGANGGVGDRTKNLLENTATTQTINGITVTVNDDKSINLSGTSSELTYIDINTNFNSSELAGYYLKLIFPENYVSATSSMIVRISSQNSRTSLQDFTTTKLINDNGNNNRLAIRVNGNYTIPDNFKLYLMVSQNSNENYEPYGYKIPVVISGKNLMPPISEWVDGFISGSGVISEPSATNKEKTSPFIPIELNKRYAFSFYPNAGQPWRCVATYDENKNYIARPYSSNTSDPIFLTPSGNVKYLRFSYRTYGDGTYSQLEQNNEVTNYEPYIEPTTTNIYLDEPIGANESKKLSDTNVNIPTINGINTLSIDTTIQPSNVYVQAPKTNNYNL